jgi:hypothetical protein
MRPKRPFSVLATCVLLYVSAVYAQNSDAPDGATARSSRAAMKTADRQTARAVQKALSHVNELDPAGITVFA